MIPILPNNCPRCGDWIPRNKERKAVYLTGCCDACARYDEGVKDGAAKERTKAAALVAAWFHEMRWSGNHLGLGDVRVTIAQADELTDAIERGEHNTEAPDAM